MEKSKQIRVKKKRARKRRFMFFCTILLVSGVALFLWKAPIFNVKNIVVQGGEHVNIDEITEKSQYLIGRNIIFLSEGDLKPITDSESYIDHIKIKKNTFNKITLVVEEGEVLYYYKQDSMNYILNNEYKVVDINESLDRNLIEVTGLNIGKLEKGEMCEIEAFPKSILDTFYPYLKRLNELYPVDSISIESFSNIKLKIGNILVYLGDESELEKKLHMVTSVLDDKSLGFTKGYINVSVTSQPVMKKEDTQNTVPDNEKKDSDIS